nr:tetratricopeptide repeat protein [Streptomyces chartreusis]
MEYRNAGDYQKAEEQLSSLYELACRVFGKRSLEVAYAANEWGVLGKYTGQFVRSNSLYQQALDIYTLRRGENNDSVATVCHNIGGLYHAQGDPGAGKRWGERAVRIRIRLHGDAHPLVASDRAAFAALLSSCNLLEEAEEQLRLALSVFEECNGPDSYDVASALHNIAALAHKRGFHAEAIEGYNRSLRIKEDVLGNDHPDLASTLTCLAAAHAALPHGTEQAEKYYTAAVNILSSRVASDHPTLRAAVRGRMRCGQAL